MSVKEAISRVVDKWFLYEPLIFNVYCTHRLEENSEIKTPFRTGKRRIEYNPALLENRSDSEIEAALFAEVARILLKHPYQRVPQNPNRAALKTASDVTLREHCLVDNQKLHDASHYNLTPRLSYEEYYKKLYFICPDFCDDNGGQDKGSTLDPSLKDGETWEYEAAANASELWDEDEVMADSVNQQILKAQQTNQWGNISGDFKETVTASLKIPMDYRRILSQFRAGIISQRRKLTRMKPSRRYDFDYMGSKFEPKTRLLVAVDVSGSIGSDDLQNFFSIINRFFSYGVESVRVIAFDSEIKQEFELKKAAKSVQVVGRGGTNFQCVVDYYESHSECQGMIVFTDGYADVPEITRPKQTLWILTGRDEYEIAREWIKKLPLSKATWIPKVGKNKQR